MNRYRKGANFERAVADRLRLAGWTVYRSAGSHGHADLVALKLGWSPLLVQAKTDGALYGQARKDLYHEAEDCGAAAVLVDRPKRGEMRFRRVIEGRLYDYAIALTRQSLDT